MTAKAPVSTAEAWAMPDDLDLGFDALITRYATHRLFDSQALARVRPDLARVIAPPEVAFAAYLADGSIVLCCPDGVPPELEPVVAPLEHLPLDRVASAPAAVPDIAARLDDFGLKLDQMQRDRQVGNQIAERLEEVKAALLEGLTRAAAPPLESSPPILEEMERLLAESERRTLAFLRDTAGAQTLAPQFEQIDQGMRQILALAANQPMLMQTLTQVEDRVATLAARPAASIDLVQQRQGFAQFLDSMGTVLRRLDGAVDRLASPPPDPRIADIGAQLATLAAQSDKVRHNAVDLGQLSGTLTALRDSVDQARDTAAATPAALHRLADQVQSLAHRPDPVLDLTAQRQSLAQFTEAMGRMLHRLELAAATFEHESGSAEIIEETKALRHDLLAPLSRMDTLAAMIPDRLARLEQIADRPAPVLDLTAQRQSLAHFATAFGTALRRMEEGTDGLHSLARTVQDMAAQAILGVAASQTVTPPGTDPEALRLSLAEAVANAFRRAGWHPTPEV